jgi:ATP-dependent helicase HrpB
MLLDGGIAKRILVLQPRRLAARMLARRVAYLRKCPLGTEVGFQTRYEKEVSEQTAIRFVTEGILLRMLQSDPQLSRVDAVVFDEFHERSVNADLGLALLLQLQKRRSDLKLILMSATLDNDAISAHLAPCANLASDGRLHPVDVSYAKPGPQRTAWELAADELGTLLRSGADGDVLIFMPGAHEIRKTVSACRDIRSGERFTILPLYGDLPPDQQDAVMEPAANRKIIVATNIAETSLTIPGVRHVIDSGLARIARYDSSHGINALPIEGICRDSADQRAGRAGREAPGTCRRLYTKSQYENRALHQSAEIHRVDLSALVLLASDLGIPDPASLPWLEAPADDRLIHAVELLAMLGLRNLDGHLTELGKRVSRLPVDPRIGRLLAAANQFGCSDDAALIAASLSERPIRSGGKAAANNFANNFRVEDCGFVSDHFATLDALHGAKSRRFDVNWCRDNGVHAGAARGVWRAADTIRSAARRAGFRDADGGPPEGILKAILTAFPDFLAARRDKGTLVCGLRNDRRAELDPNGCGRELRLLCGCGLREIRRQGQPTKLILDLVGEVREEWLDQVFPDNWEFVDELVWNRKTNAVDARSVTRCLGVVISEQANADVDPAASGDRLAEEILSRDLKLEGYDKVAREWLHRARWVATAFPERNLPAFDDEDVAVAISEMCTGKRKYDQVRKEPLLPYLQNLISWDDQQFVVKMAPARLDLPSGRKMRIKYRAGSQPRGNARIQDLFGLEETPKVGGGRHPLLLEILAPNMRPVQITDDLAGFWKNLYPQVKQELSRRYHKHKWI